MSQINSASFLSRLGWTLALLAIISILLAIASTILGAFALLIGRFLAPWFEVRTFEATVIVLGIAALLVYVFSRPSQPDICDYSEDRDEDEDWDDDEAEEVIIPPRSRNDPCPCGSGKKYRYCHGQNT